MLKIALYCKTVYLFVTTLFFQTYHPPDRRTQQEQMNDLLDEIGNEVELDSHLPDPATEIADRLARLREKPDTGKKDEDGNPIGFFLCVLKSYCIFHISLSNDI